jgi:hypothetical protein
MKAGIWVIRGLKRAADNRKRDIEHILPTITGFLD